MKKKIVQNFGKTQKKMYTFESLMSQEGKRMNGDIVALQGSPRLLWGFQGSSRFIGTPQSPSERHWRLVEAYSELSKALQGSSGFFGVLRDFWGLFWTRRVPWELLKANWGYSVRLGTPQDNSGLFFQYLISNYKFTNQIQKIALQDLCRNVFGQF